MQNTKDIQGGLEKSLCEVYIPLLEEGWDFLEVFCFMCQICNGETNTSSNPI